MLEIYNILSNSYSQQRWWPVTPDNEVVPVYSGGPKNNRQRLEVIFGAILVQNTNWKNASRAIIELNKKDLIDVDRILDIKQDELQKIIRSSGYFRQKAIKLRSVSLFLKKFSINTLLQMDIDVIRKLLLNVKGIGPETADSILLYALEKPIFVIDAYTKRIFSRLGLCKNDISYHELQEMFHEKLDKDVNLFNEYHALLVEHAKRHCKVKPLCGGCILSKVCKFQ